MLAFLLVMGAASGCADFSAADGAEGAIVPAICSNNLVTNEVWFAEWELRVSAEKISAGESFRAEVTGVVVFPEDLLNIAQEFFPGSTKLNLVELNATVHVREGATGADVTLGPDEDRFRYECAQGGASCDPKNDLAGIRGARPNADCEPQSDLNPCGRFVLLPINTDCEPAGFCARRGFTGPLSSCERHGFCIAGDLRIPLQPQTARYTAEAEGQVLFGWAEGEAAGASIEESGPNEGTWILPAAVYNDPTGPVGVRLSFDAFNAGDVAFECTMGVDCRGPLGGGCQSFGVSPAPNEVLVAFPIEPP